MKLQLQFIIICLKNTYLLIDFIILFIHLSEIYVLISVRSMC